MRTKHRRKNGKRRMAKSNNRLLKTARRRTRTQSKSGPMVGINHEKIAMLGGAAIRRLP